MKISNSKQLQYFIGKVCTIFTGPIARNFSPEEFNDYFVGIVETIDEEGVWTVHPKNNCKNYFVLSQIYGICEEEVVFKQTEEIKEKLQKEDSPFININELSKIIS
jgi:hypothetical protein